MNRSPVQNKSTNESLSTTQRQPLYSSKEKLKSHLQRIKISEPTSLCSDRHYHHHQNLAKRRTRNPCSAFSGNFSIKNLSPITRMSLESSQVQIKIATFCQFPISITITLNCVTAVSLMSDRISQINYCTVVVVSSMNCCECCCCWWTHE